MVYRNKFLMLRNVLLIACLDIYYLLSLKIDVPNHFTIFNLHSYFNPNVE